MSFDDSEFVTMHANNIFVNNQQVDYTFEVTGHFLDTDVVPSEARLGSIELDSEDSEVAVEDVEKQARKTIEENQNFFLNMIEEERQADDPTNVVHD